MPSPISDWATRISTLSSGSMTSQALISVPSAGAIWSHGSAASIAARADPGIITPMAMPPAAVSEVVRKWRRWKPMTVSLTLSSAPRRDGSLPAGADRCRSGRCW